MALNTFKCICLTPLYFKGLTDRFAVSLFERYRLRDILHRLSNDQSCSKDDLVETLEYAAKVAENIYVIEVRCVVFFVYI